MQKGRLLLQNRKSYAPLPHALPVNHDLWQHRYMKARQNLKNTVRETDTFMMPRVIVLQARAFGA